MKQIVEYRVRQIINNLSTVTAYPNYSDANAYYTDVKGAKNLLRTVVTDTEELSTILRKSDS